MLDPQLGLSVDGEPVTCPGQFEGHKFEVVLVQSDETWTIWSSHKVTQAAGRSLGAVSQPASGDAHAGP